MKYISVISLLFVLLSCSKKDEPQSQIEVKATNISLDNLEQEQTFDLKKSELEVIKLETTKTSLLGSPSKIVYANNHFYILGNKGKSVYCFSREGNFIRKIKKVGKGPGEYIQLADFDVDDEGNIFTWCISSRKIIKYSNEGTFLKTYKFDNPIFINFSLIDNDNFLLYSVITGQEYKCIAGIYDCTKKKLTPILGSPTSIEDAFPVVNYISKSKGATYFANQFKPILYKINSSNSAEGFSFESKLIPNSDQIEKFKKAKNPFQIKDNFFRSFSNIYETKDKLTFMVNYNKLMKRQMIVKDKNTGKFYCKNSFHSGEDYLLRDKVFGVAENKFFGLISASSFSRDNWVERVEKSKYSEQNKKILKTVNENSNPVIVLYKYSPKQEMTGYITR